MHILQSSKKTLFKNKAVVQTRVDHMHERVLKDPDYFLALPFMGFQKRRSFVVKGLSPGGSLF